MPRRLPHSDGQAAPQFVQLVACLRFEGARDRRMDHRPPALQLGLIGDLEGQRVLEGIFEHWVQRALVDKIPGLQTFERGHSFAWRKVGHCIEQRSSKFLADHRRALQQTLGRFRQSVDARRQHITHIGRHL